ncbi:Bug family tripartite tricarboxylate transporter substrate binding protein [Phreatobacter sp. AB_2022a]|uniref:Bug family tripartite tricarboxylate transporter substrate binding protein n=1 Tax=Phreatobacter sp. AB_2022a TaxID=3003134 RepID=UPI002286E726|nr:tripartite tricarboxylate transporter substrate binding protein [Phreatobacter sp. AB_2022a]MCZ0732979.1 tripartite tricarboxylate transporter substrate binding protein [Phreatobacter sp. AB_2022a]
MTWMSRRSMVAGGLCLMAPRVQASSDWPTRPIRIIVPFAAGGPTDFVARLVAKPLGDALGQQMVIENRPGASGNLGAQGVADADPDGYTLLHTTIATQALNPLLLPASRLRPLKDFTPVGTTAALPNVLVVKPGKHDVKTVRELAGLGARMPRGLTFGTFGHGTSPHILSLLFQKKAGFEAVPVAYRGSAPALTDILSGQLDFLFDNITTSAEQIRAGAVRGLAVTSATRSSVLPDIPTMKEAGFEGFDLNFGFSLMAPVATPAAIMTRLQDAFDPIASGPAYADQLRARGADALIVPRANLQGFLERATEGWLDVARQIGLGPAS